MGSFALVRSLAAAAVVLLALSAPAKAASIGVFGLDPFSGFLNSNGHSSQGYTVEQKSDAALLATLDTVILSRVVGTAEITDFVFNGGLLITEWEASSWALNTAGLLDAQDTGGGFVGTGTPISFTASGLATNLSSQVGSSWSTEREATEFFRSFSDIGPSVDVLATRPGDIPVILAGSYGTGTVLIMGYDWRDQAYASGTTGNELLLLEAVNFGNPAVVPLPAAGWLLATALGGLFVLRRRSKRHQGHSASETA